MSVYVLKHNPQISDTPSIKRWSLFSHSLESEYVCDCFNQQNTAEMILTQGWVKKGDSPSAMFTTTHMFRAPRYNVRNPTTLCCEKAKLHGKVQQSAVPSSSPPTPGTKHAGESLSEVLPIPQIPLWSPPNWSPRH